MKKYLFIYLFLISCFSVYNTYAQQTWQWGVRGNGNQSFQIDDKIEDMTTDANGNIYLITSLYSSPGDVDGVPINSYSNFANSDIVLSSFTCEGTLRWTKVIGGPSSDGAVSIKTDTLGGLYMSGIAMGIDGPLHIGNDTIINQGLVKYLFISKFDTSGNFKWIRFPQPDTFSIGSSPSSFHDMDVDGGGNIYLLSQLFPGNYEGNGFIATTHGIYILKYNKDGICTGELPLDMMDFAKSS